MCNLYNKNILSLTLPQVTSVFFVYILNSCSLFTADSWPGGTLLKVYLQQILPSKAYTAAKSPQIQLCALLTTNYSDGAHTILQHNISHRKEQNLFDRKETQLAKNQKNENSVSFFPSTSSFFDTAAGHSIKSFKVRGFFAKRNIQLFAQALKYD